MQSALKTIAFGLLLFTAGCIPSLYPLYTDSDLITDPALVGQWAQKNGGVWTFAPGDEKEYKLLYTDDKGKTGNFIVHLLQVEGRRYLDLFPDDPGFQQNAFYQIHFLPLHTFLRVRQIEPELRMEVLKPDWLKKQLERNPELVRHEVKDNGILLTAQPRDLQNFLQTADDQKDAWELVGPMTRIAESPAPQAQ